MPRRNAKFSGLQIKDSAIKDAAIKIIRLDLGTGTVMRTFSPCWFCGKREKEYLTGWSFQTVAFSDLRFEASSPGEFSYTVPQLDACQICATCFRLASQSLLPLNQEYLSELSLAREHFVCETTDLEMQMISHNQRQHLLGCWFNDLPITSHSTFYPGLSLYELSELGVRVFGEMNLDLHLLNQYLSRCPAFKSGERQSSFMCEKYTNSVKLSGQHLSREQRQLLCSSRVCILDATLLESP